MKTMKNHSKTQSVKVCPTCGTKLNENASRCLVCGRNFTPSEGSSTAVKKTSLQSSRLPEITISLPVALGLIILLVGIGGGVVFSFLRQTDRIIEPTITPTFTSTPTITLTPTASLTPSPLPTATELPPIEYIVKSGDFCSTIAAFFNVSIQSIVTLNNLSADCGELYEGQKLLIPQPTPTASPQPSATLSAPEQTEAACEKISYEVKANDTLSVIANTYKVSMESIRSYNKLSNDIVYEGQTLIIPLCERLPTAGPTPTETPPPPYPAPNLLLPADGAAFMNINDTITLQWASTGSLRPNEAYAVTIIDVTSSEERKITDYVKDTKYIVPKELKPADNVPHIFRWFILPVRQIGTTAEGDPIWEAAGNKSVERVFTWWGVGVTTPTPTP